MRIIEYPFVWVMGMMLKGIEAICGAWAYMRGYDSMKNKGYVLMKDDNGNEWWVGYED